jgi:extradiol dioxygenase family protein
MAAAETPNVTPFHLAFPIRNIEETTTFYRDVLGCSIGRSTENWVDFDLYGHQLSAHVRPEQVNQAAGTGEVDGHQVPIPHFGVVLTWEQWHELKDRLDAELSVDYLVEPQIRFQGKPGEQATLFIQDPSGNALEFKAFKNMEQLFAK